MAKCSECSISMGYAESQAALNHGGLCITCHVKNRVQTKVMTAKDPALSTTQKSTEIVFNKFEDMLMSTETNINLRVKQRVGIVTSDFLFEIPKVGTKELISKFFRKKSRKRSNFFSEAIELAMLELKSKAIRLDANGIIGLQIDYVAVGDFAKNGIIISLFGTAVKL